MARFMVLGQIGIDSDNGPVSLGGPRQRRLLAALLIHNGQRVSVDRLSEAVWSDGDQPDSPADALRTYVARLRRSLDAASPNDSELIVTEPGAYRLNAGETVDSIEFERLCATARSRRAVGDRPGALMVLDSALGLWTGDAYEEIRDEEWARAEAIRLEDLRVTAEEDRIDDRLTMGATADVVSSIEGMIRRYPLRERPRRQLMVALYRAGRQPDAIRAYQGFRNELAEETGLEPSDEIADLERRIIAGDPELLAETTELKGYRLSQKLGEGAFGEVFLATQPSVDRQVAVKVVRPELADDVAFIQRFEAEAQLIARLEHPNIVPLYDYWREPGGAFLVMRYLRGGSAKERLTERGPLGADQVVQIVNQVGAALMAAHAAGVVHRDVKPSNILFDELDNAYLADFGIAVNAPNFASGMAASESPRYASPESLAGEPVGPRTDVYSLGLVTWELLAGEALMPDNSSDRAAGQLQVPPELARIRPDLPDGVDRVLLRATADSTADRFATVQEFVLSFSAAFAVDPASGTTQVDTVLGSSVLPNPYMGLRAFREADANQFFGRDDVVAELSQRLREQRFMAVVGPSGAGKSSLVAAGLVPALRQAGYFVTTMTPGADPFGQLTGALHKLASAGTVGFSEYLEGSADGLSHVTADLLPPDTAGLLLVIDQFEELFVRPAPEARRAFLEMLVSAVDSDVPLRVVVTLRADFYDRPLADAALGPLVRDNTVALAAIDAKGLEQAITGPAATVGITVEPALIGELIAEVRDAPGSLPLLQYALTELYELRSGPALDLETYAAIGGVSGALVKRAEQIYASVPEGERSVVRLLFLRLISATESGDDARDHVLRSELSGVPDFVIDAFGDARLLSFDRDPGTREPTVELAHEALVREWPRLHQWVSEDRESLRAFRNLRSAALSWQDSDHDESELHRGARLEADLEVSQRPGVALNQLEQDFISASVSAADAEVQREKRQVRRLRRSLVVVGVLLLLAAVAGLFAFQQEQRADDEASTARAAGDLAETRRIAADSVARAESEPRLALLLAAEAYRRAPGVVGLSALQQVLTGTQGIAGYLGRPDNEYIDVDWVGESIVAVHWDGLEVYDANTSERRFSIDQPVAADPAWRPLTAAPLAATDSSPDGRWAAFAAADDTVVLVDLDSGESSSLGHGEKVNSVAFNNAATLLATGDATGTIRLWDPVDGDLIDSWGAHSGSLFDYSDELADVGFPVDLWMSFEGLSEVLPRGVAGLAFSADDSSLFSGEIPRIRQWDAATGDLENDWLATFSSGFSNYDGTQDGVMLTEQFEIHPTQPHLLVLGTRGDVVHFDLGTGIAERAFPFPSDRIDTNISLVGQETLTDGRQIVAMSDGRVQILDPAGEVVQTFETGLASPGGVGLSPDGSQLVASGGGAITRFALDGRRLVAETLTAADESILLSVSADGDLVAQSGVVSGPTTLHQRGANGFEQADPAAWIAENSTEIWSYPDDSSLLTAFVPSADGAETDLLVGTPLPGQEPISLGPAAVAYGWALSSERNWLVAHNEGKPTVWDLSSGQIEVTLEGLGPGNFAIVPRSFSFSADGELLVGTLQDGSYAFWETQSWDAIDIDEELGTAVIASFSPDGAWLALVGPDGTIALRDASSLELVHELSGAGPPEELGGHLVWSADGRFLVSRFESAARMWDTESGQQLGSAFPNDEGVIPGAASGGVPRLATRLGGEVLVWNLDADAWFGIACQAAGRNLTPEEWKRFGPADADYAVTCSDYPSPIDP